MTVHEGWPSFGQWQQNVAMRRRTKSMGEAFVTLTVDFSRFNETMVATGESLKHLAKGMAAKFKPTLGRWHRLGFHSKCSPIICKKAADLCNQAESDLRMEEYLDTEAAYNPLLSHSQEYWDS